MSAQRSESAAAAVDSKQVQKSSPNVKSEDKPAWRLLAQRAAHLLPHTSKKLQHHRWDASLAALAAFMEQHNGNFPRSALVDEDEKRLCQCVWLWHARCHWAWRRDGIVRRA